jgi:nucleotidyltransferase substrate binding protein (TIGR01987 family)
MNQDLRWIQRLDNFQRALGTLAEAAALAAARPLSNLESQGLIQGFEFTHELAWNVLKDYLAWQGFTGIVGSRDATRLAFKHGLIEDGDTWMAMIAARNLTSHTYQAEVAAEVTREILTRFHPALDAFASAFARRAKEEGGGACPTD